MMSFHSIWLGLTTLVLLTSLSIATPESVPEYDRRCYPAYNVTEGKLDFEDVYTPCFHSGACPTVTRLNISTPRGQGVAYIRYNEMERPLLIPNLGAWQVVNCTWAKISGQDEQFACANKSSRALYSPGKSPFDNSKPRLNTLDFPDTYIMGAVKALYFTPLRIPKDAKRVILEIVGIKTSRKTFKYEVQLDISSGKKQFFISDLKAAGFVDLKVLELWLVVDGKGGYEFALDDLYFEEYRPLPRPPSCTPTPTTTINRGPCTSPPSSTTTWTADAEEFSTHSAVPTLYKSLTWNTWTEVLNSSSLAEGNMWPPNLSTKGNFYHTYSPFTISAYSQEQRFGVASLSVSCGYYKWQVPDWSETDNWPCNLTFVGRRDPYDGDGLPSIVMANYSIPFPGRNATTSKFTTINLNRLTNSPGEFNKLFAFHIYAIHGPYSSDAPLLFDDLVMTRPVKKDQSGCRMPGGQELNFDDIQVGSGMQKMPSIYKGFLFSDSWGVNSNKNYAPGTPGSIGAISPFNEIWTGWKDTPDSYSDTRIDSYLSPANNFLFDFEEATFTMDLPEDACGYGAGSYGSQRFYRNPFWSSKSFAPDKLTFTYAEPLHAASSFTVYAYLTSGDHRRIEIFIDNFKYRKYDGPIPGCQVCGVRGGDRCEVPPLLPK